MLCTIIQVLIHILISHKHINIYYILIKYWSIDTETKDLIVNNLVGRSEYYE